MPASPTLPGATSQHHGASRRILVIIIFLLLLLLFLAVPSVSVAQSAEDSLAAPARELARRAVALTGRGASVAFSSQNLSSLREPVFEALRGRVLAELAGAGLRILAGTAAIELRMTLSEHSSGFLLTVEVLRGGEHRAVLLPFTPPAESRKETVEELRLQPALLWEQETPILDVELIELLGGVPFRLIVLDAARLAVYSRTSAGWSLAYEKQLPPLPDAARDLRGRLLHAEPELVRANVGGVRCELRLVPAVEAQCFTAPPDAQWGAEPKLNYFVNRTAGPEREFFAQAVVPADGRSLTVRSATDGVAYWSDEQKRVVAVQHDWGSELAAVRSPCDGQTHLLVTGAGDWTAPDTLRTFRPVPGEAAPTSAPLDFSGPVLMLRPSRPADTTQAPAETALGVVRNLKTSRYEAYRIRIACNR